MSTMRGEDRTRPGAVRVFQTVERDLALTDADRAEAANTARIAEQLALDDEAFLAVVVDDEPRPAFTERRVDVVIPLGQWLKNVAIGVDNIVSSCHCHFLLELHPKGW